MIGGRTKQHPEPEQYLIGQKLSLKPQDTIKRSLKNLLLLKCSFYSLVSLESLEILSYSLSSLKLFSFAMRFDAALWAPCALA